MSNELSVGERVVHPKINEWGIGQVVGSSPSDLTIYFENVGEKKLRIDISGVRKVEGRDAESAILDSKFKTKQRASRKREYDPTLFKGGRNTSRKQFVESLGATCANWNWSWSFVNHDERKIFFGAWQDFIEGNRALIFSDDWKVRRGRKSSPWPESRENIRLIEEEGYSLHVFTIIRDPDSAAGFEDGPRKIGAFLNDVAQADLLKDGGNWYAVFPMESSHFSK